MAIKRRDFLAAAGGFMTAPVVASRAISGSGREGTVGEASQVARAEDGRAFNGEYAGDYLDQIAFPLGGMGAGMFCLEGSGALSKFSFRHSPDLTTDHKVFAAVAIRDGKDLARLLEGPVPRWKLRPQFPEPTESFPHVLWGLPRYREALFSARFPFATLDLIDASMPLTVRLTGWSPFVPGDADSASLPVAALEYRFTNVSAGHIEATFSFHAENFLAQAQDPYDSEATARVLDCIESTPGGFVLKSGGEGKDDWMQARLAIWVDDPNVKVNHGWFHGQNGIIDATQMVWKDIASAAAPVREPLADDTALGASLFVPFALAPGEAKSLVVKFAWYVPRSRLSQPNFRIVRGKTERKAPGPDFYEPWYAGQFLDLAELKRHWQRHYAALRAASERFSSTLFDCTLPPEVTEAVAANLSILKSPTVMRQKDGRLWLWEGSYDSQGSCWGSCTHVWNYAQAVPHLFPALERTLRETEFVQNQGADGFQVHRASLPIASIGDTEDGRALPAAVDGQLGGVLKVYRDWHISGDKRWLRGLWPRVRASLDYCIRTWDPRHLGRIEEPHLNTYDIAFWGADCMAQSLYVGALRAAILMGRALHRDVAGYAALLPKALRVMEEGLFNGEYFLQAVQYEGLNAAFPGVTIFGAPDTADSVRLSQKEGPPYQVGSGCLSDGVLGAWLALVCGIGPIIDAGKVASHLTAVHRYNFRRTLSNHANAVRPEYACGEEAGLLVCSWPRGGKPSLPMIYADEVWCGIEYQVASHLILTGLVEQGLEIVRACRSRYDGRVRNPFSEIEAGHWYGRSLSSYALLQALSGARYDAVDEVLYLQPAIKGDFRSFLSTATGYGTVGVKDGKPFLEVASGTIPYSRIEYRAA